jgi:hypothetical protein
MPPREGEANRIQFTIKRVARRPRPRDFGCRSIERDEPHKAQLPGTELIMAGLIRCIFSFRLRRL